MIYKVKIKEQTFICDNLGLFKQKVKELMDIGITFFETGIAEEEIQPIDSEEGEKQRDKIRDKLLKKAEKEEKPKRKYNKKRSSERGRGYPKEMVSFVRQNMNEMRNPELAEAVNKKFNVNISPKNLSKWMWTQKLKRKPAKKKSKPKEIKNFKYNSPPERTQSGKIITKKKKLFSDEIDDFIEKKWSANKDSELRQLIGDKFNVFYTVDQIKAHRRMIGCVADRPGRKTEEPKESEKKSIEDLQDKYESDPDEEMTEDYEE